MNYRRRHIHARILAHIKKKEYTILIGARQVGKTTLLQALYKELKDEGQQVYYLSFENREVLDQVDTHPDNLFRFTKRPDNPLDTGNSSGERLYILIDEIQYAADPSAFLKYLYDTYLDHLKIIATGSSAFYIDTKFKDSLAGRKQIFELHSLNFLEFLEFSDRLDLANEVLQARERSNYISLKHREILDYLNQYLVYGGYPAVVLEKDLESKRDRLFELRDSYIKRDVLEGGIRNENEFFDLMTLLSAQIGNLVNKNELSNTLKLHAETLNRYLTILEKCFHIDMPKPFHKNVRKELTSMPKVYFHDLGLRNALLSRFFPFESREDKGSLLESYVYLRLKEIHHPQVIKFWRTADGNEIDFIVSSDYQTGTAFEVKFDATRTKASKYWKFSENYPEIRLQFVDYEHAYSL